MSSSISCATRNLRTHAGQRCSRACRADGNFAEKVKTQKTVVRDFLSGENGRQKLETWLPRWMKFPVECYSNHGGLRTADQWAKVQSQFAPPTAE